MTMMWADELAKAIAERFSKEIKEKTPLVIRDEKTLSGRVHVGSLRGIVIHGLIGQVLAQKGVENTFKFELNDFDPMDGLPVTLDKKTYEPHMGKSLFTVPAHEAGAENYPMVFGKELKDVVTPLGIPIEYYTLKPLYESGKFNETIRDALDNAEQIRKIYLEVSGGGKPDDWYPFSVICEKCGKIGTTQVTSWDGEKVHYTCKKDLVTWAKGCEHSGSISPFDGKGKLPWKVEWAAKWKVLGVHVEGAGKDHNAAGGSRGISNRISEEIFKYPEPFNIPYEFFNFKGKKMSASKGLGASAKEISDLLPPTLLKLLMIRKAPNQPLDFDPEGNTIPNLFDEYDRLSDHYFKRNSEPYEAFARTFELTQIDLSKPPEDIWQARFSVLSFIVQMPHLSVEKEAEKIKGSALTKAESEALSVRAKYMKQWLESSAPDTCQYVILNDLPKDFSINDDQKNALEKLVKTFSDEEIAWIGESIHETIHKVKEETGIQPKEIFQSLYQMFLGRTSGPQIGWFLSTFSREDVIKRIESAII